MATKLGGRLQRKLEDLTADTVDGAGAAADASTAPVDQEPVFPLSQRPHGPRDVSEVEGQVERYVNLGPMFVPVVDGVSMRVSMDDAGEASDLEFTAGRGVLSLEVFAAPRTEGTWPQVSQQVAESLSAQGAAVDVVDGAYGREVLARLESHDGAVFEVRIVGVDGPGWLLRATIRTATPAPAASTEAVADREPPVDDVEGAQVPEPSLAEVTDLFEQIVRGTIVRRGNQPHAVGSALPLVVDPNLVIGAPNLSSLTDAPQSRYATLPGLWT